MTWRPERKWQAPVTKGGVGRRHGDGGPSAGYLYLLPAVALLGVFILYPLARVVQYSFQSWDGVGPATYVGFSNYEQLVQPPQSSALGHIGVLFIFFAIIPTGLGLMVASLIGRVRMRGMAIFRVIFFLPQVIITVVIAIVWTWLLAPSGAGSINGILHSLGLGPAVGPAYLGDFNTALISLGLIAVWVNFGLCFLLFLSGVQRISPSSTTERVSTGPVSFASSCTLPFRSSGGRWGPCSLLRP